MEQVRLKSEQSEGADHSLEALMSAGILDLMVLGDPARLASSASVALTIGAQKLPVRTIEEFIDESKLQRSRIFEAPGEVRLPSLMVLERLLRGMDAYCGVCMHEESRGLMRREIEKTRLQIADLARPSKGRTKN